MRRSTGEAIYIARRMATAARLARSCASPGTVERWLAAWEAHAQARSVDPHASDFWSAGVVWIEGERAERGEPPA